MSDAAAPAPTAPGAAVPPGFDPAKHKTNPDGTPFLNRMGRLMPIGGRKPKAVTPAPVSAPPTAELPFVADSTAPERPPEAATPKPEAAPLPPPDFSDVAKIVKEAAPVDSAAKATPLEVVEGISHEASAEGVLRASYTVADAILSGHGEWHPEDQAEHNGLKASLVAWTKSRGGKPLPPFWSFVFACIAFVGKRLRAPKTAKRLVKMWPDLAPLLGVEPEKPVTPEPKKPAPAPVQTATAPAPAPTGKPQPVDASRFFG